MLSELPAWVVSNQESVEAESAPYRDMTPGERLEILAAVCRDAALLASIGGPERERAIREWRDPLPESSIRAFARLREQYRRDHPEEPIR